MKLSPAQRRMMDRLSEGPEMAPTTGGRESVTLLAAWHRTAASLERRGLVKVTHNGSQHWAHKV